MAEIEDFGLESLVFCYTKKDYESFNKFMAERSAKNKAVTSGWGVIESSPGVKNYVIYSYSKNLAKLAPF